MKCALKQSRADVLRENTEAVFAACDAAHGRWAKLLGVRALLHPRLRLQEFLGIYNITQEFITATEKIGGRLGYSIRGMLQSQAKAFVDFQHESKMAKIKAVLDQETWVEVDVPDEFQAIVTSLFCSEPLTAGHTDDGQGNVANRQTEPSNSQHLIAQTKSIESSTDNTAQVNSLPVIEPTENNKSDVLTSLGQSNSTNNKQRGKSSSQTLLFRGVGYHMVNCGLILLKMLSEYIDMSNYLPVLSSEVVHRVVEILKFFNTRTCQLVLGAGAMQREIALIAIATPERRRVSDHDAGEEKEKEKGFIVTPSIAMPSIVTAMVSDRDGFGSDLVLRWFQIAIGEREGERGIWFITPEIGCVAGNRLSPEIATLSPLSLSLSLLEMNSDFVVSGLKSITSKHLALASQVVSFTYAIIPGKRGVGGPMYLGWGWGFGGKATIEGLGFGSIVLNAVGLIGTESSYFSGVCSIEIRRILLSKVPDTRKALLLSEIDRVAQMSFEFQNRDCGCFKS
ncbi:hypothetical protein HYC85_018659 [Camellia sinensis]|uniref:Vacuolar protein sorting-associated protein 54 C-terminal domain-containing protein n=1 Tax=Camellia sinensis TaxID=4442 RepID=A0A7J7GUW6_CAMSI|nr:hypothetical protein HYC85_018659 [Camellia sinensis]